MFRGDSPKDELFIPTNLDIECSSDREAEVVIKSISISPHNAITHSFKNVNLTIYTREFSHRLSLPKNMTLNNLNIQFLYGPSDAWIIFELTTKTFFRKVWNVVGSLKVNFGNHLKNPNRYNGGDFKLEENMIMESRKPPVKFTVNVSIGRPSLAGIVLVLEQGTYKEVSMPTNDDKVWRFVPVIKSDASNASQVATHRYMYIIITL